MTTNHDPALDPAYVHEQTGKVIGALMMTEPIEDIAAQALTSVLSDYMGSVFNFDGVVSVNFDGVGVIMVFYFFHHYVLIVIEVYIGRCISLSSQVTCT